MSSSSWFLRWLYSFHQLHTRIPTVMGYRCGQEGSVNGLEAATAPSEAVCCKECGGPHFSSDVLSSFFFSSGGMSPRMTFSCSSDKPSWDAPFAAMVCCAALLACYQLRSGLYQVTRVSALMLE